ncbi:MAG: type II secretion system protein GspK, partial [Gemmatimonadaceae bacterium]
MKQRLQNRRGFAMITALWLMVAITVVALQFSLEAHERYMLGINAAERGVARAAVIGALALEQAQLEREIRQTANSGGSAALRRSDPWVAVDSTHTGPVDIDSVTVMVYATPGGKRLNVNTINEDQLRAFFNNLLKDATAADEIAQSIMDWRDTDDQARVRGGERDYYLKENKMVLPANAPFREVDDLLDVKGMTPEILEKARPYLRTYGTSSVNVNTADEAVLRAVPGMTDVILARILAARTAGRRLRTMNDVIPNSVQTGPPRPTQPPQTAQQQLASRVQSGVVFETVEAELTLTASAGPQALPA